MWELSVQLLVPIRFIRANRVPGTVVGAGVTKRKQTDAMQRGRSSRCTLGVLRERRTRQRVGAGHSGDREGATAESGPAGGELDAQGASQRRRCEAANAGRWAGRTRPQRAVGRGGAPTVSPRRPLQVDALVASAFLSSLFPPASGHICCCCCSCFRVFNCPSSSRPGVSLSSREDCQ